MFSCFVAKKKEKKNKLNKEEENNDNKINNNEDITNINMDNIKKWMKIL